MKRVVSPYFAQNLSAPMQAANLTLGSRQLGSSPIFKTETEEPVKLSPYFGDGNVDALNMVKKEENDSKADEKENGKKTKGGQGQRRKAPIKVDIFFKAMLFMVMGENFSLFKSRP